MVIGGWGLVGMAVCRKVLARDPKKVIVLSLKQNEAEDACKTLKTEYPKTELVPIWGDIFVRAGLKDIPRAEVIKNRAYRKQFIEDVFEKFTQDRLKNFYLYQIITEHKPDVIVDCVNAATGLAYQDVHSAYYDTKKELEKESAGLAAHDTGFDTIERFLSTVAIPQLTRHIQVLLEATKKVRVHTYVKVGTTGTGGMGLNIPYTHSEDKPSGQLLAKSALAGAHSMLLF
jgi:hypothetical protein